jgi:PAS domain S-box-containing protein
VTHPEHPQAALGETVRAFTGAIEDVTGRLSTLEMDGDEAAQAISDAVDRLHEAQREVAAEAAELRELLELERLRYRDLFEWAPDAYLVTDPAGRIREVNRAAERLFGSRRDLLVGRPLTSLLDDAERRPFRLMLGRLPTLEIVSDWELAFRHRDGTPIAVAVTVSAMRDRSDMLLGLRWLVRDVSERRAAEEQMLQANLRLDRRVAERTAELEAVARDKDEAFARLEAVLDQIPAAIVIADAASQKVIAVNEQALKLMESVAGTADAVETWLSLGYHPGGRPFEADERPLRRALASGEAVSPCQIEFRRTDGSVVLYDTSAAPIRNANGEVLGAVAAYWDLTERVRIARAEREFVTNAAHELRTPLAALSSAVEVLQAGAKDDPHQRDRFLAHIEEQSGRLQRLVRSLLMLARAQTLHEKAQRESIPVQSLLEEVAALGPAGRMRIDTELPPEASVLANRDLAEQALLNLVSNAAKYAPEGEIVLRGRIDDGFVALEVCDWGPGMTSEERKRAPERFYRGHDDADGFGLGLSIALQAAQVLEGRLELERNGTRGTRARLLLPSTPSDA